MATSWAGRLLGYGASSGVFSPDLRREAALRMWTVSHMPRPTDATRDCHERCGKSAQSNLRDGLLSEQADCRAPGATHSPEQGHLALERSLL